MIEINTNDYVFIKLTVAGKNELMRQHEEFNKEFNNILGDYIQPKEDVEGWSKWQLHHIMNKFGHMMHVGVDDIPFETVIRFNTITDYELDAMNQDNQPTNLS